MPYPDARLKKNRKKMSPEEEEEYKKEPPILVDTGDGKPFYISRKKLIQIKKKAEKGIMPDIPKTFKL